MIRRRLAVAILLTFAIVAVFVVRLVDIQVVRASELNAEALSKRMIQTSIPAPRGEIVDTNGVVLADNVTKYNITVSPRDVASFKRTADDGSTQTVSVLMRSPRLRNSPARMPTIC